MARHIERTSLDKRQALSKLELLCKESRLNLYEMACGIEMLMSRGDVRREELDRYLDGRFTVADLQLMIRHHKEPKAWETRFPGDLLAEAMRADRAAQPPKPKKEKVDPVTEKAKVNGTPESEISERDTEEQSEKSESPIGQIDMHNEALIGVLQKKAKQVPVLRAQLDQAEAKIEDIEKQAKKNALAPADTLELFKEVGRRLKNGEVQFEDYKVRNAAIQVYEQLEQLLIEGRVGA